MAHPGLGRRRCAGRQGVARRTHGGSGEDRHPASSLLRGREHPPLWPIATANRPSRRCTERSILHSVGGRTSGTDQRRRHATTCLASRALVLRRHLRRPRRAARLPVDHRRPATGPTRAGHRSCAFTKRGLTSPRSLLRSGRLLRLRLARLAAPGKGPLASSPAVPSESGQRGIRRRRLPARGPDWRPRWRRRCRSGGRIRGSR